MLPAPSVTHPMFSTPLPAGPPEGAAPAYRPSWWRRTRQAWRQWRGDDPLGFGPPSGTPTLLDHLEACWGATHIGALRASLTAVLSAPRVPPGVGTLLLERLTALTPTGEMATDPGSAWWTEAPWRALRAQIQRTQDGRWLQLVAQHTSGAVARSCAAVVPYPIARAAWRTGSRAVRSRLLEGVLAHPEATADDRVAFAEEATPSVWAGPSQIPFLLKAIPSSVRTPVTRTIASGWLSAWQPDTGGAAKTPEGGKARRQQADILNTLAAWVDTATLTATLKRCPVTHGEIWRMLWIHWRVRVLGELSLETPRQTAAVCADCMEGLVHHVRPTDWTSWVPGWTPEEQQAVTGRVPACVQQVADTLQHQTRDEQYRMGGAAAAHWQWAVGPEAPAWSPTEAAGLLRAMPALGLQGGVLPPPGVLRVLCQGVGREALKQFLSAMLGFDVPQHLAWLQQLSPDEIASFLAAGWPPFMADPTYRLLWEARFRPPARGPLFTPDTAPETVAIWWPAWAVEDLAGAAAVLAHCSTAAISALHLSTVDLLALLQLEDPAARIGAMAALRALPPEEDASWPAPTTYCHPTMKHPPLPETLAVHHPMIREGLAGTDPSYRAAHVAYVEAEARRAREEEEQRARRQREEDQRRRRRRQQRSRY